MKPVSLMAGYIGVNMEILERGKRYIVFVNEITEEKGIQCLKCFLKSYNPNDITNKYCGSCHEFHEDENIR
jgi:hypothetical protein